MEGSDYSANQVEPVIAQDVVQANPAQGKYYKGSLYINDSLFTYSGFRLSNTLINIGTYFTVSQLHVSE